MKVKLNPEIFPEDKRNESSFQAGKLNYPALVLNWELEVIEEQNDTHYGKIYWLQILNDDRFLPDHDKVWFIKDDCIVIEE